MCDLPSPVAYQGTPLSSEGIDSRGSHERWKTLSIDDSTIKQRSKKGDLRDRGSEK